MQQSRRCRVGHCLALDNSNTYMWNLEKTVQMNLFTKQKYKHRHRLWTPRGERGRQVERLGLSYTHDYV